MIVVDDVRSACETYPNVALTIGSFDGIHLGHALILDAVVKRAKEVDGTSAVLTMRPHPREFFSPENAPNLLTSESKKLELLEERGLDVVYFLPFNAQTAAMAPETFVSEIVSGRCAAKHLVVGHDCRFGKNARGDFELLTKLGAEYGYETEQVPPLLVKGERVSSTLIRERVLQGDLDRVEELLGRKYSITGEVVSGRGVGGSKLGFPTANVRPDHRAVPAQGVYAAKVLLRNEKRLAAVNIGIAPTIRQEDLTIEAHILDFDDDIRGEEIEIVFYDRLRPEMKFPSYDALVQQIQKDVETVRKRLTAVD